MKAIVYGDSILKGVLLENGKYVISHEMEDQISVTCGITILNRSRFGCTIQKAMDRIRKDSASPASENEYAVLEYGGNDCDYDWADVAAHPDTEHICRTPPADFEARYREAVRLIRFGGRIPVAVTLPPILSERYLRYICREGLSRTAILHWLGDVDAISRWQQSYSDLICKLAGEERVALLDLRSAFLSSSRRLGDLLCEDGIHPSRLGQALIADTVRRSLA